MLGYSYPLKILKDILNNSFKITSGNQCGSAQLENSSSFVLVTVNQPRVITDISTLGLHRWEKLPLFSTNTVVCVTVVIFVTNCCMC